MDKCCPSRRHPAASTTPILWILLWACMCGGHPGHRPRWNQRAAGPSAHAAGPSRSQPHQPSRLSSESPQPGTGIREDVNPVRDDSTAALVIRARNGEKQAWDELIERYAPLIWSICRGYRLSRADADDVGQSVWLGLLDHLASLRDPTALPGWLATTTR